MRARAWPGSGNFLKLGDGPTSRENDLARKSITDDRKELRAEAEARLARTPPESRSARSTSALLHELQVHQIELEMQNEELRRDQLELEEVHARQVDLYDFAPVGYLTLDDEGVVTGANLTAAGLLGQDRRSLVGRRFPGIVASRDADRWHRAFVALLQRGERAACELALTRGDGTVFDAHLSCERRSVEARPQVRIVLTDVTEFARVEEALRTTKARLSLVIDSTGDGFTDWDIPGGRVTYSRRFAAMLGYDLDELEPTVATRQRLVHPDDRQRAWDSAQPHLRGETEQYECEERLRHADGRWVWTLLRGKVVERDAGGAPLRFVGTHSDITARKQAEESRRSALAELKRHVTNTPLALVEWDGDFRVTRFSARAQEMFGWSPDEVVGKRIDEVPWVPEEDWPLVRSVMRQMDTGLQPNTVGQNRNRRKDGSVIHCEWYSSSLRDPDGKLASVFSLVQDVTTRVRAETALKESENRFRLLARVAAIGIFQTGAQGQILFVNPTYLALTGLSETEAFGPEGRMAIHPDDRERVVREWQAAVSAGAPFAAEYRHLLPNGSVNWVRMVGAPFRGGDGAMAGHVGAMVDITQPRALQAQLALASRLAALGTLVTGVAHEINNPLAADLADQGLALEIVREVRGRLEEGAPLDRQAEAKLLGDVVEALEDAQGSGLRIARIVKDLTTFGRPDSRRTRVRVIDVVKGAMRWMPTEVARTSSITVEDGEAPDVVASSGQVEQVLLNLLTNAARATAGERREPIIVRIGPGKPGMARLDVVDRGTGIEPALLERIFEPFFTTHPISEGRGTGLGLAISHAIVTAHGGTLTVQTVVGKGSTFRVELPAAPDEA